MLNIKIWKKKVFLLDMIISDIGQNVTVLSVWKRDTSRTSAKRQKKSKLVVMNYAIVMVITMQGERSWPYLKAAIVMRTSARVNASANVAKLVNTSHHMATSSVYLHTAVHGRFTYGGQTHSTFKKIVETVFMFLRSKSLHVIFIVPLSCPFTDDSFY